jgi:hypothetical protein
MISPRMKAIMSTPSFFRVVKMAIAVIIIAILFFITSYDVVVSNSKLGVIKISDDSGNIYKNENVSIILPLGSIRKNMSNFVFGKIFD